MRKPVVLVTWKMHGGGRRITAKFEVHDTPVLVVTGRDGTAGEKVMQEIRAANPDVTDRFRHLGSPATTPCGRSSGSAAPTTPD